MVRRPMTVGEMIDYVMYSIFPSPRVENIRTRIAEVDALLTDLTFDEKRERLVQMFPRHVSWVDTYLGLGRDQWQSLMEERWREYEETSPMVEFYDKVASRWSVDGDLQWTISEDFFVRGYKIRGYVRWSLEALFDSINVTEECRQIVYVNPMEDKVMYKVSTRFDDPMTAAHAKKVLYPMSGMENNKNNYVALTLTKGIGSTDIVLVVIEDIPPEDYLSFPRLKITFEIPRERGRDPALEREGAYGTTALTYFRRLFSDRSPRERELRDAIENTSFSVFDVEFFSRRYNPDYMRGLFFHFSSLPETRMFIFSDNRIKVDEQRFVVRNPVDGTPRVTGVVQEAGVLFRSPTGDLIDVLDVVGMLRSYAESHPTINPLGVLPSPIYSVRETPRDLAAGEEFVIDIIENVLGEKVPRKAILFESSFNDVCNKRDDKPEFGYDLDPSSDDVGYYPPRSVIDSLRAEGYEFPRYETQRVPIRLNYGTKILGRRKISRAVRDEMAFRGNYAFLFGFFPCKRSGVTIRPVDWEGVGVGEADEMERVASGYVFDDLKTEIPPGRFGTVRAGFFDPILPMDSNQILRMGVPESGYSLLHAVHYATRGSYVLATGPVLAELRANAAGAIPQFPDLVLSDIEREIERALTSGFFDSQLFLGAVEETFGIHLVVMEYEESDARRYVSYEFPRGAIKRNVFERLSRNPSRRTVIVLRRRFKVIDDQYDLLVHTPDPKDLKKSSGTFSTPDVLSFLRNRLTLVDARIELSRSAEKTSFVDLYSGKTSNLSVVAQVVDSLGGRSAAVVSVGGMQIPVVYTSPEEIDNTLDIISLRDFVAKPRPSIADVYLTGPLRNLPLVGVGVTTLTRKTLASSLYLATPSQTIIVLVSPEPLTEATFPGAVPTRFETPDPYIIQQFTSGVAGRDGGSSAFTVIYRRSVLKELVTILMSILFLEVLERFLQYGFSSEEYVAWRNNLFATYPHRDPAPFTPDNLSHPYVTRLAFEIRSFQGYLPRNPMKTIYLASQGAIRAFIGGPDENSLQFLCFSPEMLTRLEGQLRMFEEIIPTIPEFAEGAVPPLFAYRVSGIYDNILLLSQSREAVLGIEDLGATKYAFWGERCQLPNARYEIYDNLAKDLFRARSKLYPITGFFARENTGLWAIRPASDTPDNDRVVYRGEPSNVLFSGAMPDTINVENQGAVVTLERIV